jgi:hypothetical protein
MITFWVVPSASARSASQSAKAVSTRRLIRVLLRRLGITAGGCVGAICSAISRILAGGSRVEAGGLVAGCWSAETVATLFSFLAAILTPLRLLIFTH